MCLKLVFQLGSFDSDITQDVKILALFVLVICVHFCILLFPLFLIKSWHWHIHLSIILLSLLLLLRQLLPNKFSMILFLQLHLYSKTFSFHYLADNRPKTTNPLRYILIIISSETEKFIENNSVLETQVEIQVSYSFIYPGSLNSRFNSSLLLWVIHLTVASSCHLLLPFVLGIKIDFLKGSLLPLPIHNECFSFFATTRVFHTVMTKVILLLYSWESIAITSWKSCKLEVSSLYS